MQTKLTWILTGVAGLLVVGGAVAGSQLLGDDDNDAADLLSVDLAQGGSHSVSATAASPPGNVEADYELRNTGSAPARVTLTLSGPDGSILESKSATVPAGAHVTVEIEHAFSGKGAAGLYKATLVVDQGQVHLTEGGVDIDEKDDGEDEDE